MSSPVLVSILASTRVDGMYLYLPRDAPFDDLPEALRQRFGAPREVLDLVLRDGRRLARTDAATVRGAIAEQGFYLQLPPQPGDDPVATLVRQHEQERRDGAG